MLKNTKKYCSKNLMIRCESNGKFSYRLRIGSNSWYYSGPVFPAPWIASTAGLNHEMAVRENSKMMLLEALAENN